MFILNGIFLRVKVPFKGPLWAKERERNREEGKAGDATKESNQTKRGTTGRAICSAMLDNIYTVTSDRFLMLFEQYVILYICDGQIYVNRVCGCDYE